MKTKYEGDRREKQLASRRAYVARNAEANRRDQKKYRDSGRPEELRKMRQYGLAEGEYQAMLQAQKGLCAICDQPMKKPHIDHDHDTGHVRGLLCFSCNTGLGHFADDRDRLLGALTYLGGENSKNIR